MGARLVMGDIRTFLWGAAALLVLGGVSSGLRMIVDTDLNYKEKYLGVSHE